ncbi:hypothetical protein CHU98_g2153 [Xylaria longipes]|nr:hypothetical protein CHU98_g2153 [Xylaria longipes]
MSSVNISLDSDFIIDARASRNVTIHEPLENLPQPPPTSTQLNRHPSGTRNPARRYYKLNWLNSLTSHFASTQLAKMPETTTPAPSSAVSRPVSEALLNEKWDRCVSNMLIKSTLGLGFGVVFSVLLFRRRAWPAFVGVGFGAGRAYEECNWSLKQASRDLKKAA